jgi:hypothetical protein
MGSICKRHTGGWRNTKTPQTQLLKPVMRREEATVRGRPGQRSGYVHRLFSKLGTVLERGIQPNGEAMP